MSPATARQHRKNWLAKNRLSTVLGDCSVFECIYGTTGGNETHRPGSFARILKSGRPIVALIGHDKDKQIASTADGSLELLEDSFGLLVRARFNPEGDAGCL